MFEMKNENDETATKHKNEDFFKKLDHDRRQKGCEYAVLCTLLEPESELYNAGIVDVSYRYEKMYVIRPQFFIPIITLLRNAAMGSLRYKQELAEYKQQNIDVTNFEAKMEKFKDGFSRTITWRASSLNRPSRRLMLPSNSSRRPRTTCAAAPRTCAWPTTRLMNLRSASLLGVTRP